MSSAVHRRMLKEYMAIQKNAATRPHLELLEPIQEDDLLHWQAILLGTADSAYEGGRFKLDIVIPTSYPIQSPTIRFVTKICHPNVHFKVKKNRLAPRTTTIQIYSRFFLVSTALCPHFVQFLYLPPMDRNTLLCKGHPQSLRFFVGCVLLGNNATTQSGGTERERHHPRGKKTNSSKLIGSLGNWHGSVGKQSGADRMEIRTILGTGQLATHDRRMRSGPGWTLDLTERGRVLFPSINWSSAAALCYSHHRFATPTLLNGPETLMKWIDRLSCGKTRSTRLQHGPDTTPFF